MQLKYHLVTIEDLVPQNHFLRKLETSLDLSFVYKETAHLYSQGKGPGKWAAGSDGLHPCEGQRLPRFRGDGRRAGGGRELLETAGRL